VAELSGGRRLDRNGLASRGLVDKRMMRRTWVVVSLLVLACGAVRAESWESSIPSPVGKWVTIDDERNEPRSRVRIYESGGPLFADIEEIFARVAAGSFAGPWLTVAVLLGMIAGSPIRQRRDWWSWNPNF